MGVGRHSCAALAAAALAALLAAPTAAPDRAPVPGSAVPPWSDPAHRSGLELLAGQIAGALAGRQVGVRCESPDDWQALVDQGGGGAAFELGFVPVDFDPVTGTITSDASLVELSPSVCAQLQLFAAAVTKPTKCSVRTVETTTAWVTHRVRVRRTALVDGSRRVVTTWVTTRSRRTSSRVVVRPPGPCFRDGRPVVGGNAFWSSYAATATALLVLAHESVHLTQDRAGLALLPSQQAESEAQCVGMQWLPFVAEQLGDTADDAEAIAQYVYHDIYPGFEGTPYWSADCAPGRTLDRRPPGATAWP